MSAWNEKYTSLLADKDVKRWFDNVARGSLITAEVYLRRLGAFCAKQKLTPRQLSKMNVKDLENLLLDLISDMERAGYAGSYTHSNIKAIKSWLLFNDIELREGKLRIKGATEAPTLKEERVPTQDELALIFRSGDKKQRAESVLISHSGLRPEVEGNYKGLDGLRIRDLPEIEITQDGLVKFQEVPTMVVVRSSLSKAGHEYFSFLGEEGCSYLKEYLEERLRGGEGLKPDSPVITPKTAPKPFLRTTNIGDSIRGAIRAGGFAWRPYVLRAFFETQMMIAESKGQILRDYRVFFMGHKGDIEHRYSLNKGKLPKEVIEDLRRAYKRATQFLQTTRPKDSDSQMRKSFWEGLLLTKYSSAEVSKFNIEEMGNEELVKLMRAKQSESKMIQADGGSRTNRGEVEMPIRHTTVPINQLQQFLATGCRYVDKYTDETGIQQAIIEVSF